MPDPGQPDFNTSEHMRLQKFFCVCVVRLELFIAYLVMVCFIYFAQKSKQKNIFYCQVV